MTAICKNTFNPIRDVVERINAKPNPMKKLISLSVGDPTIYGNFGPPDSGVDALRSGEGRLDGYLHSSGLKSSRTMIAERYSHPTGALTSEDVFLTWGCSQAISMAIQALAEPASGDCILLPRPGFPLYAVECRQMGIRFDYYDIRPKKVGDKSVWTVDITSLHSLIKVHGENNIKAILVCNPSNPTGGVSTREESQEILKIAEKINAVVIADEIYADMTFSDAPKFEHLASLSTTVPIIEVGGLAKKYMCPGWRMGWALVHDRQNKLKNVRDGISKLCSVTLGPASVIQSLISPMLRDTPDSYFSDTMEALEANAKRVFEALNQVQGLEVIEPQGAMYAMIRVDLDAMKLESGIDFTNKLLEEESVFVLPGECFEMPGFFRVTLSPPGDMLETACNRIRSFCNKRTQAANITSPPLKSQAGMA